MLVSWNVLGKDVREPKGSLAEFDIAKYVNRLVVCWRRQVVNTVACSRRLVANTEPLLTKLRFRRSKKKLNSVSVSTFVPTVV